MQLSVVIITKNEAHNIVQCIQSVDFADEVIVLDSGSVDGTVDLARSLGAKVFENSDWQGFGIQKQRALSLANGKWVLSLDADERISQDLRMHIVRIANQPKHRNQPFGYEIARQTQFCGQWIKHCGWSPDWVLRLFLKEYASFSPDYVHERVILEAKSPTGTDEGHISLQIGRIKEPILHYSYPDVRSYWLKLSGYSQAWASQRYLQGKTTSVPRAVLAAVVAFIRTYFVRLGFLDGAMGLAVCIMQSQAAFGKYFTLYGMHRTARAKSEILK